MFLHNWQFQFDYTTLNSTRHEASSTVMNYSNGVCVQHQMWTAHGERWCKLSRMFDVYYCSFLLDFCRKVLHIFTRNSYKLWGGKNNRSGTDYFHFTFWQKSKIATLFKFTFFKSNEAIFSTFREMWGMCIKITWAPNALPINPANITGATWLQCSSDTSELRMRILYVRILLIRVCIFYFKEKFCVSAVASASLWLARSILSKAFQRPCRKNDISGYIWHKSFIQTVNCSFFSQRNAYQSFCGGLLTFGYFLLLKFCVSARIRKWLVRCL